MLCSHIWLGSYWLLEKKTLDKSVVYCVVLTTVVRDCWFSRYPIVMHFQAFDNILLVMVESDGIVVCRK